MGLYSAVDWLPRLLRRRRREQALRAAASWPTVVAKVVKVAVVAKDPAAEQGTAFEGSQVECAFYFTLNGEYHGGHLRSLPVSDSAAHRLIEMVGEETEVLVRYDPASPDETHTLAEDNDDRLPFAIWPT